MVNPNCHCERSEANLRMWIVPRVCFLAALLAISSPADDFGFRTECTKTEIFQGESLACSFVLASSDEMVEVEVAKFPEFRGYWSENIALRQGPIPLLSVPFGDNIRKGIVGTYSLIPMIGKADPLILPMKIVVRHPLSAIHADLTVDSEPATIKIKPLPPLPSELSKEKFSGAVGSFSLELETREVLFQKDEPTQLRISLQGEGNFPEINTIDLPLPNQAEVLSRRVYSQGSGQFSSVTFEITLAPHTDQDFIVPSASFVFFDPAKQKYENLTLPEIPFRFRATLPKLANDEREPIAWRGPEESLTLHVPVYQRPTFWIFHALAFLIALVVITLKLVREWGERRRQNPKFQRALRTEIALQAAQMGNIEMFLRLSDQIAFDVICEISKHSLPCTRHEVLNSCRGRLEPHLLDSAHLLFQAHDDFLYSPEKKSPPQIELLREALRALSPSTTKKRAA